MTAGKGTVVLVLIAVALGLVAYRTGRGQLFLDAVNGKQVINR
jgi:hypothetical protein